MSREWWIENWHVVLIAMIVIALSVASLIWPDSNLGCSVSIESKPS